MQRIKQSMVDGAFRRLHRAMGWPNLRPYDQDTKEPNVGAVYLVDTGMGYQIQENRNKNGGTDVHFVGWRSKRDAYDQMVAMSQAVEYYKRENGDLLELLREAEDFLRGNLEGEDEADQPWVTVWYKIRDALNHYPT